MPQGKWNFPVVFIQHHLEQTQETGYKLRLIVPTCHAFSVGDHRGRNTGRRPGEWSLDQHIGPGLSDVINAPRCGNSIRQ